MWHDLAVSSQSHTILMRKEDSVENQVGILRAVRAGGGVSKKATIILSLLYISRKLLPIESPEFHKRIKKVSKLKATVIPPEPFNIPARFCCIWLGAAWLATTCPVDARTLFPVLY